MLRTTDEANVQAGSGAVLCCEAIDVHAHFGAYRSAYPRMQNEFSSGNAEIVVKRARKANTRLTVVSPLAALLPRGNADPIGGNEEAARVVAETEGLLQWVVANPLKPMSFEQAEEMLKLPRCVGIKVHPEEHGYPITEQGGAIFEFASEHGAVVISHAGQQNSAPEDFVPFANAFPEVRLILSHLGNSDDNDPTHHVRAIQACKRDSVFVDTSSARSITPNLLEWAVREIGAERILYGTDSPIYFAPAQRARIDHADITDDEKRLILCGNAERLFGL